MNYYDFIKSEYILLIYVLTQSYLAYRIGKRIYNNKARYLRQRFITYVLVPLFFLMNGSCIFTQVKVENSFYSFGIKVFKGWLIISIVISITMIISLLWRGGIRLFSKASIKKDKKNEENKVTNLCKVDLDKRLYMRIESINNIRKNLRIEEVDIKILNNKIKDSINLRILQLTDFHIGAFLHPDIAEEVIKMSNALGSDLIFLTGDFINIDRRLAKVCIDILSQLKARFGVYGCLGNHEVLTETEDYFGREFKKRGIHILRNTYEKLEFINSDIYIVGFDYFYTAKEYKEMCSIFKKVPGDRSIVLCHNPSYFPIFAKQNTLMMFAGHTHGGQIKFEVGPAVIAPSLFLSPYLHGLYCIDNSNLYVSRGIGTSGAPIRISCPPEITLCNLKIN